MGYGDDDPSHVSPWSTTLEAMEIAKIRVLETLVGGNIVYKASALPGVR